MTMLFHSQTIRDFVPQGDFLRGIDFALPCNSTDCGSSRGIPFDRLRVTNDLEMELFR